MCAGYCREKTIGERPFCRGLIRRERDGRNTVFESGICRVRIDAVEVFPVGEVFTSGYDAFDSALKFGDSRLFSVLRGEFAAAVGGFGVEYADLVHRTPFDGTIGLADGFRVGLKSFPYRSDSDFNALGDICREFYLRFDACGTHKGSARKD